MGQLAASSPYMEYIENMVVSVEFHYQSVDNVRSGMEHSVSEGNGPDLDSSELPRQHRIM